MDGEPDINLEDLWGDFIEIIRKYFDAFCSAFNPSYDVGSDNPCKLRFLEIPIDNKEKDLINLINRVQRHTRHGQHCLRLDKKSKLLKYRFKFSKKLIQ